MEGVSRPGCGALIENLQARTSTEPLTSILSMALSRLQAINWYGQVGQPPDEADQLCVEAYLTALGYTGWDIHFVNDIDAVKRCTKVNFEPNWFETEESFRRQLIESIAASNQDAYHRCFRTVIDPMSERVMQAAERNLATDELQVLKVAAGCAIEACYQYALEMAVTATGAGVFGSKMTLFERGRWPLTVSAKTFYVY